MSANTNETIPEILAEIGEKSDFCHNNILLKAGMIGRRCTNGSLIFGDASTRHGLVSGTIC